ncbi:BrnT family toxin [Falsiroseomonas ponticola]|uniref:BrnT family toxin n=1 Tax=Falsiroseomonas ponticola TaxID=2786951 RepID=UPI00193489B6|nr:BrnT family toxin [Roseomonas ponticola]
MRFSWDEWKAADNLRKHGVRFEAAIRVFDDPSHRTRLDDTRHEQRWQTIGMPSSANPLVLLVVHAQWVSGDDEEVRIISARRATPRERRAYHAGKFSADDA